MMLRITDLSVARGGLRLELAGKHARLVAVAEDVWVKLKIVVNAGGTSAEFFVNGTSVGTQSTNLPTGDISPALGIVKTAGTTERVLYADAFRLQQVLTAAR